MSLAPQTFTGLLDEFGNLVPILALQPTHASLSVSGASARVALPGNGVVYRLSASKDCWLQFGDANVVAAVGDMLFLQGTEIVRLPTAATHIAAITVDGTSAQLGITEMLGEN